jgi:hypothetical protein
MIDPDFFGAPRTGVHSYRLFDIAIVDAGLTLVAALAWTRTTGTPLAQTSAVLFMSGIIAHWAVGVNTAVGVKLFGVL